MNKKNIILIAAAALISGGMIFQNCGGTLTRTADFEVSRSSVESQIKALEANGGTSTNANSQAAFTKLDQILKSEGSAIYYAEVPSTLGDMTTVMPLEWKALGVNPPSAGHAYFAYANFDSGPQGVLIVTGTTPTAAPATAPAPAPATEPPGATTTPAATTTTAETVLFVLSSGDTFGTSDGDTTTLHTIDSTGAAVDMLSQDDLGNDDVVQFELLDAERLSLGLINLVLAK